MLKELKLRLYAAVISVTANFSPTDSLGIGAIGLVAFATATLVLSPVPVILKRVAVRIADSIR
jgi:hypothetical protein